MKRSFPIVGTQRVKEGKGNLTNQLTQRREIVTTCEGQERVDEKVKLNKKKKNPITYTLEYPDSSNQD